MKIYDNHLYVNEDLNNSLILDDCFNVLKSIKNKSIDLVFADLPYNLTGTAWDVKLDLNKLWIEYERILKDDGIIALFSIQPFTTHLINSNISLWRYNWYWEKDKSRGGNFMNAKNSPIKVIEEICIFGKHKVKHEKFKNRLRYNPQGLIEYNKEVKGKKKTNSTIDLKNTHNFNRPSHKETYIREYTNYPCNILKYKHLKDDIGLHPTQKPLSLCEYIIKTYTNEQDIVVDNTMGAGTIPLAALKTNRKFIGIDNNKEFFDKAVIRLNTYINNNEEINRK